MPAASTKRLVVFFVLGLLLSGWLLSRHALVSLTLRTDTRGVFKIYWAGQGQRYSEARSASVAIRPGRKQYAFFIGDLGKIHSLRIDPLDRPGKIVIGGIRISQVPFKAVEISSRQGSPRPAPLNQIAKLEFRRAGIAVTTDGRDPQLETAVRVRSDSRSWLAAVVKIAVLAAVLGLLAEMAVRVPAGFDYAPGLMALVLGLIMAMAVVSRFNMHPDEYVHVRAAGFYETHWLPPAICAPEAAGTYSVHGVSRLDSFEAVYFFAGKFSRMLEMAPMERYLRLRFFNLALFGTLLWLCLVKSRHRLLYLPLLASPQVWYIFSYFNSDAFSLFICFLLGYMVVERKSPASRLLLDDLPSTGFLIRLAFTGVLLTMVPLLKLNFYFFGIFLVVFLAIRLLENGFSLPAVVWKRLAMVALIALVLAAGRFGFDVYQNGWHRSEKLTDCRNRQARPRFRPDTPLKDQYFGLNLRKRGVSVRQVFERYGWGRVSFQSTFGVYGYMSLYGSPFYYQAVKYLLYLLAALLLWTTLWRTSLFLKMDMANLLMCAAALVAAAFWNSWNVDLQNQGRYFLPIFAMAGVLMVQAEKRLPAKLLNLVVICLFILGTYSFLFYGLLPIPKI